MNIISTTDPIYRPREGAAAQETAGAQGHADTAPKPVAPAKASRIPLLLATAAALIAAFAATLSAVGLAAASRTVAEAHVAIDGLRAAHPAAAAPSAPPAHTPEMAPDSASIAQIADAVQRLRADIARYQTERDRADPAATVHDGQVEIANRLGAIEVRLGRMEKALSSSR